MEAAVDVISLFKSDSAAKLYEMDLEGAHIFEAQLIKRSTEDPAEQLDSVNVGTPRRW